MTREYRRYKQASKQSTHEISIKGSVRDVAVAITCKNKLLRETTELLESTMSVVFITDSKLINYTAIITDSVRWNVSSW